MVIHKEKGKALLRILHNAGYSSYFVGGCVRDKFLSATVKDWDITSNALPSQVVEIFRNQGYHVIETGLQHGTVTVVWDDGTRFEVTTYRMEGNNHLHPQGVWDKIKLDLARRDFRMNAMVENIEGEIFDPFGGECDIKEKVIRCVGSPSARFREDGLRILRALRFSSCLGFEIASKTEEAMFQHKDLLLEIATERIAEEFKALISGKSASYVLNRYRDIFAVFLPEIIPMFGCEQQNKYHPYDVWTHTLCAIEHLEIKDPVVSIAMLFHDIGKPSCKTIGEDGVGHFYMHGEISAQMTENCLKRLRFSKTLMQQIKTLVRYHDYDVQPSKKSVRRLFQRIGVENLDYFLAIKRGDIMGQDFSFALERLKNLEKIKEIASALQEEGDCFGLAQCHINGRDLLEMGVPSGELIGEILRKLCNEVIEEQIPNEKEALLTRAKEIYEK